MTLREWVEKYESLSAEHRGFVRRVASLPGVKYGAEPHYAKGDEKPLWEIPEELDLIVCVGTFRWECTLICSLA